MIGAASKFARNLAGLARRPELAGEYVGWLMGSLRTGGNPTRTMLDGIRVGGFTNFSEYHSVPLFINEAERAFFENFPIGDGAILDVGANVGLVSLLLARRFPDRSIHAFEPNPSTFEALTGNVARNRAANVHCHRSAVSNADGTILFDNDPIKRGTASIALEAGTNAAEVPAVTLDSFVAEHGIKQIGFLKIDVEGFETLVLAGAARTLAEVRPAAIYFEVCPILTDRAGFLASGPAQTLVDAAYDIFRIAPDGALRPAQPSETANVHLENWLATPR